MSQRHLSWEIVDTPDGGDAVVIERLSGELESRGHRSRGGARLPDAGKRRAA